MPTEDTVSSKFEPFFIFEFRFFQNISAKKNNCNNSVMFPLPNLWTEEVWQYLGLNTRLVSWSALTIWVITFAHTWHKRLWTGHVPLALHCGSLLRPQLICKWPNIVFKQTLSYGKFHQPLLSTQLLLFLLRP